MLNNFLFIGLPYTALFIMLFGSIIRYRLRGYQVSSLASQFLEGKNLFYGSLPFHIGIVFLFFGHLTAFLFPSSVIAWNHQPVRLIILEITAFSFALAVLTGLTLLVIRRLTNKRIQIVTSKMDVVVFLILLTQVISGLIIAYYHRWGSTWFATIMTPYLKSIFTFTPDPRIIENMPFVIKLHIVTAFTIVGLIPFTRFMHFLVFPFQYITRRLQFVIWNRDKKTIRDSEEWREGTKASNN